MPAIPEDIGTEMGEWRDDGKKIPTAYFYLHINGQVIVKSAHIVGDPEQYFESDFVIAWWLVESHEDRVAMLYDLKNKHNKMVSGKEKAWGITGADYFKHAVKAAAEGGK